MKKSDSKLSFMDLGGSCIRSLPALTQEETVVHDFSPSAHNHEKSYFTQTQETQPNRYSINHFLKKPAKSELIEALNKFLEQNLTVNKAPLNKRSNSQLEMLSQSPYLQASDNKMIFKIITRF